MKKELLLLLILLTGTSVNVFSQITFEKGYYIDTFDKKVDCFIENNDWKDNPLNFKYKLAKDAKVQIATITDVKEFSVNEEFKYIKSTTQIDRSNDAINQLDDNSAPKFVKETQFLKVLIEGKASLYSFEDSKIKRFFYRVDESNIEQLVFKSYIIPVNKLVKNYSFRKQILENLICPNISIKQIQKIEYNRQSLFDFFELYNKCSDSEFQNFDNTKKTDLFNLNIRPGLSYTSMTFFSRQSIIDINQLYFESKASIRFGIEGEFLLPYNKNKWAILIEPNYHAYKSRRDIDLGVEMSYIEVNYKSLEFPVGLRYYMFLNENSSIFINALAISDINFDTAVSFGSDLDVEVKTRLNAGFGLGYRFKRLSIETRYNRKRARNIDLSWNVSYEKLAVIIGYSLF